MTQLTEPVSGATTPQTGARLEFRPLRKPVPDSNFAAFANRCQTRISPPLRNFVSGSVLPNTALPFVLPNTALPFVLPNTALPL
jgi:hypothetical protein